MDSELMDAGAQAERTALAWQRTGIGAMAIGVLLMRGYVHQQLLPLWPGLLLTSAATFAVLILTPRRYRRVLASVRAGTTPVSRWMVPAVTLTLALATIGIGIELVLT